MQIDNMEPPYPAATATPHNAEQQGRQACDILLRRARSPALPQALPARP